MVVWKLHLEFRKQRFALIGLYFLLSESLYTELQMQYFHQLIYIYHIIYHISIYNITHAFRIQGSLLVGRATLRLALKGHGVTFKWLFLFPVPSSAFQIVEAAALNFEHIQKHSFNQTIINTFFATTENYAWFWVDMKMSFSFGMTTEQWIFPSVLSSYIW